MLIGLSGFKRSGKDTAAIALVRAGFVRLAFADAVRSELFQKHPDAAQIKDDQKEQPQDILGGRSLRDLLIEIGQGRRAENPDYWVQTLEPTLKTHLQNGKSVVISDVRMPNEIDLLRKFSAKMVWITREGVTSNGHATEQDLEFLCDHTLRNDGAPHHLQKQALALLDIPLCGRCKHFKPDRSFAQYGFCAAIQGDYEAKARLMDLFDPCRAPGQLFAPS